MMRFCTKILLVDADADDGNVIDERSYSLGEIDGKDEYNILKKIQFLLSTA